MQPSIRSRRSAQAQAAVAGRIAPCDESSQGVVASRSLDRPRDGQHQPRADGLDEDAQRRLGEFEARCNARAGQFEQLQELFQLALRLQIHSTPEEKALPLRKGTTHLL
ncbi:hypothetical protein [Burkholderia ubonensis]|uniref:hypothetical protein n=1 Tax=Burkholderia ubonensis TaxID=101571 RepID=UPI001E5080A5|nr:hypothetical protein [Burkholderia ubonensis]